MFSCKGGYRFQIVQDDLVKHIFPDIVCGTVAGSPLETSALEIVVFRFDGFPSVQIQTASAFPTEKVSSISIFSTVSLSKYKLILCLFFEFIFSPLPALHQTVTPYFIA